MTFGPHGTPEPERLLRVRIIGSGAVTAPRPGAWSAFPGDVIEVADCVATSLIANDQAELVDEASS